MTEHRQLAVVLFADIAGYTALMQKDEDSALQILQRFKTELFRSVKTHEGEIIQYFGDGCLTVFSNAADAIASAKIIQEKLREEPAVPVRIGIHLGDVLYREGNIFGDCVNIASRIESMGVPGAILFSDAIKKQIKNKPEFIVSSLGEFEFKNVDEPMEIFALANKGFPIPRRNVMDGKFKEKTLKKSIAVLPFVNMSNDPEQEYFSDGIAEEILNSLTHINDLTVAGRISSFQFRGKNSNLKDIGDKLGVKTVLEGSVRKQGSRVRITAQLVNVTDGYQLWSERFDREMNDIFSIQDEIALSVTEALKLTLLKKDKEIMTKNHTQNPQAYELFLKGIFNLNKRGGSLFPAMQFFQQAIELDPGFALAYTGLADANLFMATYGLAPPRLLLPKAKQAAEKALELDPLLAEAYCSLGYYYACFEWDWKKSNQNFHKSIEINPRYCHTHSWYMWTQLSLIEGKFSEAEELCKAALKLEPLSATLYGTYSLILHTAGKLEEALPVCQLGIELDPYSFLCQVNKGIISMELHKYEEAIAAYSFVSNISKRHHFAVNGLIWNYCETGEIEKARTLMNELLERCQKEYIAKMFTAMSLAYLNDLDLAFEYLEKAYEERDPLLLTLKYEQWGPANFRSDPRFEKFVEKINFPH